MQFIDIYYSLLLSLSLSLSSFIPHRTIHSDTAYEKLRVWVDICVFRFRGLFKTVVNFINGRTRM